MTYNIGIAGDRDSFSHQAAIQYSEDKQIEGASLSFLIDMSGVLKALNNNDIDIGIFPVMNCNTGLVKEAFSAMGNYPFLMIDQLELDVKQSLMVLPGVSVDQINTIASHPQAIAQCQSYIDSHYKQANVVEWIDTAQAAKDLACGVLDSTVAVIAPAPSAQQYNLQLIENNIQDTDPNTTTFIIVKHPGK